MVSASGCFIIQQTNKLPVYLVGLMAICGVLCLPLSPRVLWKWDKVGDTGQAEGSTFGFLR